MKKLGFVLLVLMVAFSTVALTGGEPPPPADPILCPEGTYTEEKSVCTKEYTGCPAGYFPGLFNKCWKKVEGEWVSTEKVTYCTAYSEPVCLILGCTDDAALNFNPDAQMDDKSCYYECDFTHEVEGLSSPGAWTEWEFDGEEFNRCREIKTAIQHRDDTTDKICSVESRSTKQCETHPDACTNLEGGQFEVPEGYILVEGICVEKPPELEAVTVGVNITCGSPAGDGVVYQTFFGLSVNPAGGATLTFDGQEYTEGAGGHAGFGNYPWSAVANKGYIIDGPSEGVAGVKRGDCNDEPKEVPPTGGGDAGLAVVAFMATGGLLALGVGIREITKAKKER